MVGLRSVRLVSQVLDHLRSDLSVSVLEYLDKVPVEDCRSEMVDFPELVVRVEREDWQDGQGKLLSLGTPALGNFSGLNKRSLYFACTKVLNFRSLMDLWETKWTEVVGADSSPKGLRGGCGGGRVERKQISAAPPAGQKHTHEPFLTVTAFFSVTVTHAATLTTVSPAENLELERSSKPAQLNSLQTPHALHMCTFSSH
ncbi:hypothetical protein MHYP_G00147460 [Metynnis hypsauchen]